MAYWQDEIFKQVNVSLHAPSGAVSHSRMFNVGVSSGSAFFPHHYDKRLAALTWPEWLHLREAQGQLGRLPRMQIMREYQPKPLVPLFEVDEDDNVLLKPDRRLVSAGR